MSVSELATGQSCEPSVTVVVCHLEPVMIEGMRMLLNPCSDLKFQQRADSLIKAADILHCIRPSILLLDRAFGPKVILNWLTDLRSNRLESIVSTGIVIWGVSGDDIDAVALLRGGVRGLLPKSADFPTVLKCLRAVAAGRAWAEGRTSIRDEGLTTREKEVQQLVQQGLKNREIAAQLGIREGTVKIHLLHLYTKTGLRRQALTLKAFLSQHAGPMENDQV